MDRFDIFLEKFRALFDLRERKNQLTWIIIGLTVLIPYLILTFDIIGFFRNIPLDWSAKNFILVVIVGLLLGVTRALSNWKKFKEKFTDSSKKIFSLVEWFALIMMPLQPAIEVITKNGLSLYWIYFPFLIASSIWISIGVKIGGYPLKNWHPFYAQMFVTGCWILISIGIYMYLQFDFEYQYERFKLFPWLEHPEI